MSYAQRLKLALTTTLVLALLPHNGLAAGSYPDSGATGCIDLIANGDFEAGVAGWTQSSAAGYELVSDFFPRSGNLGAYLAGVNDANDRLGQAVALPADAGRIDLSLWRAIATEEIAGEFDTLAVALHDPDGTLLASLAVIDNSAEVNLWQPLVIDISAYRGQAVVLALEAQTDGSNPTDFYVDDVSITACEAQPAGFSQYLPLVLARSTERQIGDEARE